MNLESLKRVKKHIVTSLIAFSALFTYCIDGHAQNANITGTVLEKRTGDAIQSASIRILNLTDSAFLKGGLTDTDGNFTINVATGRYIVQITSIGFTDHFVNVDITKNVYNTGKILMSENSILLSEATVMGKAVEITVKDDTLEYNAASYKVHQTAVVEDMLKKMPGVDVDENGIIRVNGKEVKKILIDGKEFFTDDPKIASKNLPANMIDKVQVVDQKSETAQMTGFFDGDDETVINLTIKPGMKRSVFGDVAAGYGTDDHYGLRGMANYIDDNTQMSVLAATNNTNNIGFSDAAADIYAGNRSQTGMNNSGTSGLSKTSNAGANFGKNYSTKNKLSGDISYGQVDKDVSILKRDRQYIGTDKRILSSSDTNNEDKTLKANFRIDWYLDPVTRLVARASVQSFKNYSFSEGESETIVGTDTLKNTHNINSGESDGDRLRLNSSLNINRRMKKKGRTVTLGISANINDYDRDGLRYSRTDYINTSRKPSVTDEYYIQDDKTVTYGLNLSYVEPLTKNNFLQVKYSLQSQNSETDKITYKKADADSSLYDVVVPNSTRKVDNIFVTQSMQVNFKRTLKKYNFIAGLTAQQSSTKTSVTLPNSAEKENPKKNITNISPNFEFNYKWSKRHNLRLQYTTRIRPASSLQLYDGVISQSTTDSLRGNPNLQPRFVGTGTLRYQNYNSKKASMLIIESGVTHIKNDIVIATTWEGTKRSRIYENINGNMDGNLQVIYNTPLRNKKLSFNSNSLIRYNIQNTFVNPDSSATLLQNKSKILTFREITGLRYNSDLFDFDVRGSVSYNNVKNNIVSNNNRNTLNFGGYASCYFYLPHNMILSTDLTFTANAGYSSEYQQEEWLWNIMVAKEIFKKKNGIIRLNVYDILKKRSYITENSTADYMQYTSTNVIGAYAMLNFVYKFNFSNK